MVNTTPYWRECWLFISNTSWYFHLYITSILRTMLFHSWIGFRMYIFLTTVIPFLYSCCYLLVLIDTILSCLESYWTKLKSLPCLYISTYTVIDESENLQKNWIWLDNLLFQLFRLWQYQNFHFRLKFITTYLFRFVRFISSCRI